MCAGPRYFPAIIGEATALASRLEGMETFSTLPGTGPGTTLLLVHAHPDDETIATGATMAAAAGAGTRVVLVTCTRGELGEVIPPELAHLEVKAADLPPVPFPETKDDGGHLPGHAASPGAGLAVQREHELASALAALGVHEQIWLGQGATAPAAGPVVFRDSGMQWGNDGRATAASTVLPGSFSRAPLAETAGLLAQAIRDLRPDVVVTYASDGGYGHPDHIGAHELTVTALRQARAAGPAAARPGEPAPVATGWKVPAVYTIVSDRPERPLDDGAPRIAVAGDLAAKTAAMRAHQTQIVVDGGRYALSDQVWRDISVVEEFTPLDAGIIYGNGADSP